MDMYLCTIIVFWQEGSCIITIVEMT